MHLPGYKIKIYVLIAIAAIACIVMCFVKPIAQDPNYHFFADARSFFGVPNFWNVMSNVPYLVFGIAGMTFMIQQRNNAVFSKAFVGYFVFFAGVSLICFGSAYYHAFPDSKTLVWDRLPMTIAFMGFFAGIISEFIHERWGKLLLWPLVAFGIYSVLYWHYTEEAGKGDLRMYAIVQFLPMILIPFIVILFKSTQQTRYLWLMMLSYLVAKVFEACDKCIFFDTFFLSGHTLKHFAASCASMFLLIGLYKRKKYPTFIP